MKTICNHTEVTIIGDENDLCCMGCGHEIHENVIPVAHVYQQECKLPTCETCGEELYIEYDVNWIGCLKCN